MCEIPLVRARRPAPSGVALSEAFATERQRLASTVEAPLKDIAIIGVFPGIPIASVCKLSLEADGEELHFWLKPQALDAAARPRFMTLIIGRRRSTGKLVQTVV